MKIRHNTILCIGECMVEMSPNEDGSYTKGYAGDTFNTAWYLKAEMPNTWRVSYLTALGDDAASDQMIEFIDASGVSTEHVARLTNKTAGLYMIHLNDGERSFSYWRENSAARELANDSLKLDAAMQTAGVVYFSGITVAILRDNGRKNLLAALKRARENGSTIVFDPNLRPRLWESTDKMRDEITRAAAVSNIILPSFDDEANYFGDTDPMATIERYQRSGAELVVVKNGVGEILATSPDLETVSYNPKIIENPVDTTAAGDSFNAGFLSTYLVTNDLKQALGAGSELSGQIINQRGALIKTPQTSQ